MSHDHVYISNLIRHSRTRKRLGSIATERAGGIEREGYISNGGTRHNVNLKHDPDKPGFRGLYVPFFFSFVITKIHFTHALVPGIQVCSSTDTTP